MTDVAPPRPEHPAVTIARTGPEAMPLCVRMRSVRYGLRASVPLLTITAVIFVPLGVLLMVSEDSLEPLLAFAAIPLVFYVGFAAFMAIRSRGPVLAADSDGVWMRPGLSWALSAWQPWHGIQWVAVRRFVGMRLLCVKPRDSAYEQWFAIRPAGSREVRVALRIVRYWQERRCQTTLTVPLAQADHALDDVVERLRVLAADRCPVE